jgi:hypothetical protein
MNKLWELSQEGEGKVVKCCLNYFKKKQKTNKQTNIFDLYDIDGSVLEQDHVKWAKTRMCIHRSVYIYLNL